MPGGGELAVARRGVPADVVERYVSAGWWGTRTVGELVASYAASRPDDTAVITPQRRFTWSDYHRCAERIAAAAAGAGVDAGEMVGVCLPDGLQVHAAFVAMQRIGAVTVGIGSRAGDAETAHLLTKTRATTLVRAAGHGDRDRIGLLADLSRHGVTLRRLIELDVDAYDAEDMIYVYDATVPTLPEVDVEPIDPAALTARALGPNDLSMLNSTSGTTGLPKCVMQFENRWFHFADLAARAGALTGDDVFLGAVPAPFGFGLWTSHFAPAALGVPTVVMPRFSADEMVRLIERERVTVLGCVSTQFRMLLNSPLCDTTDLSSLRVMFTGGEAVPFEQAVEFERRTGATALQFFGSNETGAFSCTTPADSARVRLRSAGRLIEHMNVRLYDESGADITDSGAPGQPGGVGPLTCLGYYDDEVANGELFTAGGAMLMGDLVTIEDGVLSVVGRKSDIVIRGGKNISAAQVEAEVGTHPAVALVVVVPVPDDVFGERVCALVTLRPEHELTLADLAAHLAARGVTREWHPEHLVVLDEIPRSSGGKLAKGDARRIALDALTNPGSTVARALYSSTARRT